MADPDPQRIALVAVPESTGSTLLGMYDLFAAAGGIWDLLTTGVPGPARYRPELVARSREPLAIANGVTIQPHLALDEAGAPGIVCVPEVFVAPDEDLCGRFDEEARWLGDCYRAGSIVAAACSGALMLGEAGLLDEQDATTHWAYCDTLEARYPGVRVHRQRAIVAAGEGQRLVMAGGGTSWQDLALYLIARTADVEEALQLARAFLIDWHDVGQQPFAVLSRTRQVDDVVIARCQEWVATHYSQPTPVASMARLSGLPDRSFKRRFRQATGFTPLEYVHAVRLEAAKERLERGTEPVEAIAEEIGYEDSSFFSRLFRRKVGMTPAHYRRRFGALREALLGEHAAM